jgi:hypothetical protein
MDGTGQKGALPLSGPHPSKGLRAFANLNLASGATVGMVAETRPCAPKRPLRGLGRLRRFAPTDGGPGGPATWRVEVRRRAEPSSDDHRPMPTIIQQRA